MIKVNLLSPEKKEISGVSAEGAGFPEEERERKISNGAIIAAVIITLGIIGGLWYTQSQTMQQKEQYLQERQARKKALDEVLETLKQLEKAKKLLEKKIQLISELKRSQEDTVKMMDALCNALPDWVWLTSLNFKKRQLSIVGKAIHNNLISDLINNLKGTGSFYDVQFPGSTRQKQSGQDIFNFRINCSYKDKDTAAKTKTGKKPKAG